ncbi:MAG: hypothetical protein R3Y28_00250 [Candidatus Gastranaerophilales bacterium]
MNEVCKSLSPEDAVVVDNATTQTLKETGLADKGVEIIKATKENSDEIKKILMSEVDNNPLGKYLSESMKKKEINKAKTMFDKGMNAAYFKSKKIIMPEKDLGLAVFHEIGHAANANLSKVGKALQNCRATQLLSYPIAAVALLKNKKAEGQEPKNNFDKETSYNPRAGSINTCDKYMYDGQSEEIKADGSKWVRSGWTNPVQVDPAGTHLEELENARAEYAKSVGANNTSTPTFKGASEDLGADVEKKGMSTGAKIAIGTLVATGVAIAADLIFAQGKHIDDLFSGFKGKVDDVKPTSGEAKPNQIFDDVADAVSNDSRKTGSNTSEPIIPEIVSSNGKPKQTRVNPDNPNIRNAEVVEEIKTPAVTTPKVETKTVKVETSKVETPKVEPPKGKVQPKVETKTVKVETPKVETPKVETPKVVAQPTKVKVETPKVETPKPEGVGFEVPKFETSQRKVETPKSKTVGAKVEKIATDVNDTATAMMLINRDDFLPLGGKVTSGAKKATGLVDEAEELVVGTRSGFADEAEDLLTGTRSGYADEAEDLLTGTRTSYADDFDDIYDPLNPNNRFNPASPYYDVDDFSSSGFDDAIDGFDDGISSSSLIDDVSDGFDELFGM